MTTFTTQDRQDAQRAMIPTMDLLDYFAAKALQGMLASPNCETEVNVKILSENAYTIARAMIHTKGEKSES